MTDRPAAAVPRVLMTGFAPFGEFPVNSSWELARRFQGQTISMVDIETALQHARDFPGLRGVGFIHIPPLPEQNAPAISIAALQAGLRRVIESIVAGAAPLYSLVEAEIEAERRVEARGATHG